MARHAHQHDRRLAYVRKWFQRASRTNDPFDRFFYLWIAAVVAAQRYRTEYPGPEDEEDTDRRKVTAYFEGHVDQVFEAFQENQGNMMQLARRRGTDYGDPIVDTRHPELRRKFSRLATHYTQSPILPRQELVQNVAELFNKIRNNLFHGVKVYDDAEDVRLLELVNLVLRDVLGKCERLRAPT